MRWIVFMLATALVMGTDALLGHVLGVHWHGVPLRPSIMPALAVFITLAAPRLSALWACLLLGMLVDLSSPLALGDPGINTAYVLGPNALGFVFGGYFVFQIRSMVFRRRALTIAALSVVFSLAAALVAMAFFLVRGVYPGEPVLHWKNGTAGGALIRQLFVAVYGGLLALPIGWLLLTTSPIWGFLGAMRNRSWR